MTECKKIHIAMINSFNVLTKKTNVNKVIYSDLPLLAHDVQGGIDEPTLRFITKYFESIEMFEKCAELDKIRESIAAPGELIDESICGCDLPNPMKYSRKTKCETCKKQICP